MQTEDPKEVLDSWMAKFTGQGSKGLIADFEVVARGGDHEGYCYVLVPRNFN